MMTVKARDGYYQVIVASKRGLESFFITKINGKVECTCGASGCAHVSAVRAYIDAGGQLAGTSVPQEVEKIAGIKRCPVCGAQTIKCGTNWRCAADSAHFFEWLNQKHGDKVRKWMCGEGKEAWEKIISEQP